MHTFTQDIFEVITVGFPLFSVQAFMIGFSVPLLSFIILNYMLKKLDIYRKSDATLSVGIVFYCILLSFGGFGSALMVLSFLLVTGIILLITEKFKNVLSFPLIK